MNYQKIKSLVDVSGKTYIITGGAGILGGEMACALVSCGANVAILDRLPEQAGRLKERLDRGPGRSIVLLANVLQKESLTQARDSILKEFGRVDGLINAAGGNKPDATTSIDLPFFDLPEEALRFVFDLNILGTMIPCQVFCRDFANQESGVILNVSSMNADRPLTRIPAYSAAKAGVSNFTRWLAVHLAQTYSPNIRVNALAPGFFLTSQNRFLMTDPETGQLSERGQTIIQHTPMNRFGTPEDLFGTMIWLLSPASEFVTGIVVPVDGGFSAYSGV
ncbi:MAG: SDR family oxidoreductase [Anaerolineales bacterium]|nr:SDR family oxidoreductase [Anaerolineales bacterium]